MVEGDIGGHAASSYSPVAAQSHAQLRAILMGWDVVGVAGLPGTADEYDCLIGPLVDRLREGASAKTIGQWLMREVEQHFGLDAELDRERAVAKAVVSWWSTRGAVSGSG